MPPKSSSKKSNINWYRCEKCSIYLISKDRDVHEELCPLNNETEKKFCFIKNGTLYTDMVNVKSESEELKEISKRLQNNLIFISEDSMILCGFFIGQHVTIKIAGNSDVPPIVRQVWPINEKLFTTVLASEEDFQNSWIKMKGEQLQVKGLDLEPFLAREITLKILNEEKEDLSELTNDFKSEITKVLSIHLRSLVFCVGNKIVYDFYNKNLTLSIEDFKAINDQEESLENSLKNLQIGENLDSRKYFKIVNETVIKISNFSVESKSNTNEYSSRINKGQIGGLREVIQSIEDSLQMALGLKEAPKGIKISRGILLHGPSGCGKTMLCEALSNEIKTNVIRINTSSIYSKYLGETEMNLRKFFHEAYKNYPEPTLIVIEDLNNICPKSDPTDLIKRVSACFASILDEIHTKREASKIALLATATNVENINPAIRRCGRIDYEIEIGAPDPKGRHEILSKTLQNIQHNLTDEQITEIANITHGFVGSDIMNLISQAIIASHKQNRKALEVADLNTALNQVKPSAMREISIENPNVKWSDIGGQEELKLILKQAIEWPLLYPEKFKRLGINAPRGILMFGPPGCSKTMIAKALATESRVNFLSIKGPELFSMWVGESERAVREVFRKARQIAPAIVFFDEIDAISGERSTGGGGSSVKERVLTQLLTEMDGVNTLKNVTIVAATNRPDMIDKALLRPGRIDRIVYVGLPDEKTREEIIKIKLKNIPTANDVNIIEIVKRTEGYSGAEIQALCNEAALKTLEEDFNLEFVYWRHFEESLKIVRPRTSSDLLKLYEDYLKQQS